MPSPSQLTCRGRLQRLHIARNQKNGPGQVEAWSRLVGYVPAKRPVRAARAMLGGHSATFTSKVTLLDPGPRLRTSNLNFPPLAGVNFTSHFGPGLVSLPTSFLFWA